MNSRQNRCSVVNLADGCHSRSLLSHERTAQWFTGLPPAHGVCPGVDRGGKIRPLPIPDLACCTRDQVKDYFNNSWTLTEVLFSALVSEEAFYTPPYHGLRHPFVFYYMHPAILYVNKLLIAGIIEEPINREYESLFETGVDEMSWDDMSKNTMKWPDLDSLHKYRKAAYDRIINVIDSHPGLEAGHRPIGQNDALWSLFMSFEHERIHLETSSVLIRELPVDLVSTPPAWPDVYELKVEVARAPQPLQDFQDNQLIAVPQGKVQIGKPESATTFGWDNEYGHRVENVEAFEVSRNLITNGEFWEFVAAGGYSEQRYWSDEGWRWRGFRNTKWPTFWYADGAAGSNRYKLRTCFDVVPMQWQWPVIVNYYEAKAYCAWKAEKDGLTGEFYRLLSEAEHHRLRQLVAESSQDVEVRNAVSETTARHNLNLAHGSECPVSLDPQCEGVPGDVFGNVWQWCEDHFNPLPGFKVNRLYEDFSTPCFDGKHQMIMGGSFVSTGAESSQWARFHFRPHFFQQAGFRLVKSTGNGGAVNLESAVDLNNKYESQEILNEYLTLHYAPAELQMPHPLFVEEVTQFPRRCADLVIKWTKELGIAPGRAIDIGCAVGGAAFSLAREFDHVTGVDLSENFICAATRLKQEGYLEFDSKREGYLASKLRTEVDRFLADKAVFKRADACALPPEFVDFDAALLANLICRLPDPLACLSRMGGSRGVVRPGGLLVITTPFTWQTQYTATDRWLGGYETAEHIERISEAGLIEALSPQFDLLDRFDMPLVIREHHRKYQLIVTLATVWQRKGQDCGAA